MMRTAQVLGGIRGPLAGPMRDAFLGPTARREKPEVVATVNELARRVKVTSGRHAVTSVVPRRPDQRDLFGTIRTPVLVVAGGEDATFPVAETEEMADSIPGARFVVLEQSAHLAALESRPRPWWVDVRGAGLCTGNPGKEPVISDVHQSNGGEVRR
jgi:3-oxoadipate enol-lactonase